MTKMLKVEYPSIADIAFTPRYITHNQMGIDNIELIAKYEVFKKMAEKMGLTIEPMPHNHKIHERIDYEMKADKTTRLKSDKFMPIVEVIQLPKVGKDKPLYITIIRNTPTLFDVATHHKKAKDTFCLMLFAGLHQPTKKISSEAMKIISKFTKRKAFSVRSIDLAIDTTDHRSITHNMKEAFRANLMPYSKHGVICKGSSLYINNLDHTSITRVLYYDKYLKQLNQQKKEKIGNDLRAWKRLEITLTFDVTKKQNKGFTHYIESMEFIDDVYEVHVVSQKAQIKSYEDDYLIYQLNSLLDNRFMNNKASKTQFNSVESLKRFKHSDFRRYVLAI